MSPSRNVMLTVNCTIELSNLWLLSYGWRMYLWVEGPAPAYSAKFTSTNPNFRKCLPPFSSYKYSHSLKKDIFIIGKWRQFFMIKPRNGVNVNTLTIRIDIRHLHVSRIPELAFAFILHGKANRAEYLTQWFCTSILKWDKFTSY